MPDLTPAARVDTWNAAHPVGSHVEYWPGTYDAVSQTGVTTHPAMVLGGHTPVVWIDTCGSCVALTHVQVIEEGARRIRPVPVNGAISALEYLGAADIAEGNSDA